MINPKKLNLKDIFFFIIRWYFITYRLFRIVLTAVFANFDLPQAVNSGKNRSFYKAAICKRTIYFHPFRAIKLYNYENQRIT